MSYVERRNGRYRARYRDPLGRVTSNTFDRKADALRFLAEMETDKGRGSWIDPRHADLPLARWSEEFLALGLTARLNEHPTGSGCSSSHRGSHAG
jgi:hypothetical protein